MHLRKLIRLTLALTPVWGFNAHALTGVHPTGVNVRSTGPTSVFITFQGTAGQKSTDAFWCGDITVPANTVTAFNPCVPGTFFGRLPPRHNLAQPSGTGGATNLTDIMTIPSSVARRAYQAAQAGAKSSFFYVRRFVDDTGAQQFVAVTCRMAGGGARVPLALMNVDSYFKAPEGNRPVYLLSEQEQSPEIEARIYYNGSGRLKGRWEVVMPGDPEPRPEDLLSEASLPVEKRALQRRYTVLDRIDIFLPPTGQAYIPGPPVDRIPTTAKGPYKILLRIEPTRDKEGDSKTTTGVVRSGGLAGFSLPVLRYYVGSPEEVAQARQKIVTGTLPLLLPQAGRKIRSEVPLDFTWGDIPGAEIYRLEIRTDGETLLTALVKPGVSTYSAPPWLREQAGQKLFWRVQALEKNNTVLGQSQWREFAIEE